MGGGGGGGVGGGGVVGAGRVGGAPLNHKAHLYNKQF